MSGLLPSAKIVLEIVASIDEFMQDIGGDDGAERVRKRLRRQRSRFPFAKTLECPFELAFLQYGYSVRSKDARQKRHAYEVWIGVPAGLRDLAPRRMNARPDKVQPAPEDWGIYGFVLVFRRVGKSLAGCVLALCNSDRPRGLLHRKTSTARPGLKTPWQIGLPVYRNESTEASATGIAKLGEELPLDLPVRTLFHAARNVPIGAEALTWIVAYTLKGCGVLRKSESELVRKRLEAYLYLETDKGRNACPISVTSAPSPERLRVLARNLDSGLQEFNHGCPGAFERYLSCAIRRMLLAQAKAAASESKELQASGVEYSGW